jgi:endonuclease-3
MSIILDILSKEYPDVKIQLNHTTPFELLVATILSAQCTDERVNKVTAFLFSKYKTPEDYIKIPIEELEKDIFSTGYYKSKARHIKEMSKMIVEQFLGEIPTKLEDLIKLPGVGRKTANVILGHCFATPAIVVDTHVIKIINRLGFVESKNPEIIERKLMELIPTEKWVIFTHYFINHGRKICTARKPKCKECVIAKYCKFNLENNGN